MEAGSSLCFTREATATSATGGGGHKPIVGSRGGAVPRAGASQTGGAGECSSAEGRVVALAMASAVAAAAVVAAAVVMGWWADGWWVGG